MLILKFYINNLYIEFSFTFLLNSILNLIILHIKREVFFKASHIFQEHKNNYFFSQTQHKNISYGCAIFLFSIYRNLQFVHFISENNCVTKLIYVFN